MPEIVGQLQRHQVFLQQDEIKSELLDPVVDVPRMADSLLNTMLLIDKDLVTLNRASRHKQDVGVFDINGVLQKQLLDHLLH